MNFIQKMVDEFNKERPTQDLTDAFTRCYEAGAEQLARQMLLYIKNNLHTYPEESDDLLGDIEHKLYKLLDKKAKKVDDNISIGKQLLEHTF